MPLLHTVTIEKHGDRFVVFCSAHPEIRAEGDTPKSADALLKVSIRQAIQEGVLQQSDWEEFLEDDLSDYEDLVIEGIGNLKEFERKTVGEIQSRVSGDRYGFFSSCTPIPEGWPTEVMLRRENPKVKDSTLVWSMNRIGKEWRPFEYQDVNYLRTNGRETAYIFERAKSGDSVAYWPIVSLWFAQGRGCTQAGTRRCRWYIVDDGESEYDGSKIKFKYSDEFKMVMRRGCGLALLAGEREITHDVLEKAIESVHAVEPLPWRVYRVSADVVKILQTANQIAENAGEAPIGVDCVVAAIRQFKEGPPPAGRTGADV